MATTAGCESSPPPTKRPKIADDYPGSGPNLDQSQFEPTPQISGISKAGLVQDVAGDLQKQELAASRTSCDEPEGHEGQDSGISDGATPPTHCDDSQDSFLPQPSTSSGPNHSNQNALGPPKYPPVPTLHQDQEELLDEDSLLEEAAELNLPPEDGQDQDHHHHHIHYHSGAHVYTNNPLDTRPTGVDLNEEDEDDRLSDISGISDLSGSEWKPTAGPFSWVQRQMMSGADPRALLQDMLSADTVIPNHLDQLTLWKIILNMVSEPPRRKKLENVNTLDNVVNLIRSSKKIVVLTGAGVSVSCGIPDFRSRDGVYARLAVDFPDLPDPQAMFDIHYFRRDPRPFFKFAREIYPGQFEPSPCHRFIKCVEKHGKLLRNYTQNIDTLEQVVGIQNVVQCHGSFATATCMRCKHKVAAEVIREDIFEQRIPKCPECPEDKPPSITPPPPPASMSEPEVTASTSTSGPESADVLRSATPPPPPVPAIMKPDIVFFGEGLGDEFHNAVAKDKDQVDLLIMIGSSLKVRPVALIPSSINPSVPQILINREPLPHLTPDVELLGDCDGIVNQICRMLGEGWEEPVHKEGLDESLELLPKQNIDATEESDEKAQKSNESQEEPSTSEVGQSSSAVENEPSTDEVNAEESEEKIDAKLAKLWQARVRESMSKRLKPNHYFFAPPSRYVFPGAEVFDKDDQEEDSSDDESDSDDGEEVQDESNTQDQQSPAEASQQQQKSEEPTSRSETVSVAGQSSNS